VARIVAHAAHAHEPALFTTAPVPAIRKVLAKAGWTIDDVDLFEVNEAFAVVAMIAIQELGIPEDKINVNGGATALGHPIGASGTRIIATLLGALETRGLKRGVASLCIGGGEATRWRWSWSERPRPLASTAAGDYLERHGRLSPPLPPKRRLADLKAFIATGDRDHRVPVAIISVLMPALIIAGFLKDSYVERPGPEMTFIESWPADRSDAEIIAQQKIDEAKRQAAVAERQRQFKVVERQLGL
jgi:hypothetical protein